MRAVRLISDPPLWCHGQPGVDGLIGWRDQRLTIKAERWTHAGRYIHYPLKSRGSRPPQPPHRCVARGRARGGGASRRMRKLEENLSMTACFCHVGILAVFFFPLAQRNQGVNRTGTRAGISEKLLAGSHTLHCSLLLKRPNSVFCLNQTARVPGISLCPTQRAPHLRQRSVRAEPKAPALQIEVSPPADARVGPADGSRAVPCRRRRRRQEGGAERRCRSYTGKATVAVGVLVPGDGAPTCGYTRPQDHNSGP